MYEDHAVICVNFHGGMCSSENRNGIYTFADLPNTLRSNYRAIIEQQANFLIITKATVATKGICNAEISYVVL